MKTAKEIKQLLLDIFNNSLNEAEDSLIEDSYPKELLDPDETADIPQAIREIKIVNSSIGTDLYVNGKLCADWEKI